jgi:hypothetical protein
MSILALFLLLGIVAAPDGQASSMFSYSRYEYEIDGWQVTCGSGTQLFDQCEGVKRIAAAEVHLLTTPYGLKITALGCGIPRRTPANELFFARDQIGTFDLADRLAGEINLGEGACRAFRFSGAAGRRAVDLIALLLAATEAKRR